MRLFRALAVTIALAVFLALPSIVGAASNYTAYVACSYRVDRPAATSCHKSGRIGAFFKSNNADVQFKTCVTFPNGQTQCTGKSTAKQGTFYINHITAGTKGTLTVRWRVAGTVVAKYSIKVK